MVDYLKHGNDNNKLPKHRAKLIQVEAENYTLIKDQLYKRGKDKSLRLCVPETKYLEILHHAHARIAG